MIDVEKVVLSEVDYRARKNARLLLETLSACAAELGADSVVGATAKVLVDQVYGDNFAKPFNPGPSTYTPNSEAPIAHSAGGIPVYAHSPHVVARHQV